MQFQVPQFIESEDKIIGPLSLKQFMYIAIAGFMMFLLFFILETIVWGILSFFVLAAAAALAFIKYNGQSLPALIASAFKYIWHPKFFLWSAKAAAEAAEKSREKSPVMAGAYVSESAPEFPIDEKTQNIRSVKSQQTSFVSGEEIESKNNSRLDSLWLRLATHKESPNEEAIPNKEPKKSKEIFDLFQKITGEREVARRVDYR